MSSWILRPHIPDSALPLALMVYNGDSPPPEDDGKRYRSGDLYLGPTNIWIMRGGEWLQWNPSIPLLLDIDGDELYTSPCVSQGIQFLDDEQIHASQLAKARLAFCLGDADDITAAVAEKIRAAAGGKGTKEKNSQHMSTGPAPPTNQGDVPSGRRLRKHTADASQSGDGQPKVASNPKKGKRKADQKSGKTTDNGGANDSDRLAAGKKEVKRRKGTPTMNSLLDGIGCPKNTETVEWRNLGVTTYVPWFSDPDAHAVNLMAQAPRAQDQMYGPGRPFIVELEYDDSSERALSRLTSVIEQALSKGCAVLVRGWEPGPPREFTADSIRTYRPTLSQPVEVLDAVRRGKEHAKGANGDISKIHESTTLADVIATAKKPNTCLNLLDLPNLQPDVPVFVRPLSDNVNARSALINETYLEKVGENAGKTYHGVQVLSGDGERLRGWDIITHGGFLTYAHHDAGGLCTYVTVRSGTKIWGYINTVDATSASLNDLFKDWDALFLVSAEMKMVERFPIGTTVLRCGDTLIQPPGVNHMVFSSQNGLTSGGHFLSYSTMHLSLVAIAYDSSSLPGSSVETRGQIATNAVHPSIHRHVIWMVLGLPLLAADQSRTFYRRSLLALINLMDNANSYMTSETLDAMPNMTEDDTLLQEIEGEHHAAMEIVASLKTHLQVVDAAQELGQGSWWDPGPRCQLSTAFM